MVPTEATHSNKDIPSIVYMDRLEKRVKKLENLCQEINPFIPISDDLKDKLSLVGIVHWRDPDHLTKQIILMFEDSVKELRDLQNPTLQ